MSTFICKYVRPQSFLLTIRPRRGLAIWLDWVTSRERHENFFRITTRENSFPTWLQSTETNITKLYTLLFKINYYICTGLSFFLLLVESSSHYFIYLEIFHEHSNVCQLVDTNQGVYWQNLLHDVRHVAEVWLYERYRKVWWNGTLVWLPYLT